MATKIKKNIEKGKDSVWFSGGERLRGIEHMGGLTPNPSPNGEGSRKYCLLGMNRDSLPMKERL